MEASPPPPAVFTCCPKSIEEVNSTPTNLVQNEELENLEQQIIALGQFVENAERNTRTDKLDHKDNFTLIRWKIYDYQFFYMAGHMATEWNTLFWHLYGPSIKILTLVKCRIPYCYTLLSHVFWRAVPNLERLSLLDCKMEVNLKVFYPDTYSHVKLIELIKQQANELNKEISDKQNQLDTPKNTSRHRENPVKPLKKRLSDLRQKQRKLKLELNKITLYEDPIMKEMLLLKCQDLASTPTNLRFLEIENLKSRLPIRIAWSRRGDVFPCLKYLVVRRQDVTGLKISHVTSLRNRLEEVDVMNFSNQVGVIKCETFLQLSTKRLSFDCGHDTSYATVTRFVEPHAAKIEKLCLFRAPFAKTYDDFPCQKQLQNLTVCHLWGNVTKDLNLFKLTPRLKEFKWITDCYDEETRGSRLINKTGKKDCWVDAETIVENTEDICIPTLNNMKIFQLETGPLSLSSLKKLGRMFPELQVFKAALDGDEILIHIGKQWQQLEHLEIAQCNSVTAKGIWNTISVHKVFPSLNNFTWKWCACSKLNLEEEETRAVTELRKKFGENSVYTYMNPQLERSPVCLRKLFKEALVPPAMSGLERIGNLMRAIGPSTTQHDE